MSPLIPPQWQGSVGARGSLINVTLIYDYEGFIDEISAVHTAITRGSTRP